MTFPVIRLQKLFSQKAYFSITLLYFSISHRLLLPLSFKNKNLKDRIVSFVDSVDDNYRSGDEVKLHYVNSRGESASAKLEEANDIIPSIILPDKCYDVEKDTINFKEIQNECLNLLLKIQIDNSYYPDENN